MSHSRGFGWTIEGQASQHVKGEGEAAGVQVPTAVAQQTRVHLHCVSTSFLPHLASHLHPRRSLEPWGARVRLCQPSRRHSGGAFRNIIPSESRVRWTQMAHLGKGSDVRVARDTNALWMCSHTAAAHHSPRASNRDRRLQDAHFEREVVVKVASAGIMSAMTCLGLLPVACLLVSGDGQAPRQSTVPSHTTCTAESGVRRISTSTYLHPLDGILRRASLSLVLEITKPLLFSALLSAPLRATSQGASLQPLAPALATAPKDDPLRDDGLGFN